MSESVYSEPGIIRREESIVDIYVSAESLKVYDNPWVMDKSPNIPAGPQHPGTDATSVSDK